MSNEKSINCLKEIKLIFNKAINNTENQLLEIGEHKWQQLVESNDEVSRELKEFMELEQKIDDQLEAMYKDLLVTPEADRDAKYQNLKKIAAAFYTLTLDFA